jgi:hypothetical protein
VVAFRQGGACETVLDAGERKVGSGVFFDEQTPESLAQAMRWLEAHPEKFSPAIARQQSLKFNAERYERELVGYLEQVVGAGRALRRAG